MNFHGIEIVVSDRLPKVVQDRKQVRFPRSKGKRIRKKWAKDPRNWHTTYKRQAYAIGGKLYCDPETAEALKKMPASAAERIAKATPPAFISSWSPKDLDESIKEAAKAMGGLNRITPNLTKAMYLRPDPAPFRVQPDYNRLLRNRFCDNSCF
jgi:hypothetical protein